MRSRTGLRGIVLLACALLSASCSRGPFTAYTSIEGDWKAQVPYGWRVITDRDGDTFTETSFIGAFEPSFILGVPSFRVRWYAYGAAHRLPDGQLELYQSAEDFIQQTLRDVYQPHQEMFRPVSRQEVNGRMAEYFVVMSPARVPDSLQWGTKLDADTGHAYNVRKHAYLIFPMSRGFYVLIYPATSEGYDTYYNQWDVLGRSFTILKDGPGGPAAGIVFPPAASSEAKAPPKPASAKR